jgi:Sec-independent protein translocase protein TatA
LASDKQPAATANSSSTWHILGSTGSARVLAAAGSIVVSSSKALGAAKQELKQEQEQEQREEQEQEEEQELSRSRSCNCSSVCLIRPAAATQGAENLELESYY